MSGKTEDVRVAIIGCGAVTRATHLPLLAEHPRARIAALVDPVLPRAEALARHYEVPFVTGDHRDVIGRADAALIATPNHLHAPIARELLAGGVHVLVEKPMAPTAAECESMIEAAESGGGVLAVGLVRRFYETGRLVKDLVETGVLGSAERVTFREGMRFAWPVQSDYLVRKDAAGGGVLVDTGAHVLDLLVWWFGDPVRVAYRDDAEGGVEAECEIELGFEGGIEGSVALTRLRDIPNLCRVEFERGAVEIEAPSFCDSVVRLELRGRRSTLRGQACAEGDTFMTAYREQLDDFLAAAAGAHAPAVSGHEGRRAIDLMERCYAARQPLHHPWERPLTFAAELAPA